ncbi:hypothetical protein JGH11_19710, partial [Dysgonomonas sp. Marseille-P4677]|uniref:hypothetical protein n=1 Tax=Dysgonomonas sp. Marseille-P4677 TaxID=2364790 RepID=UPI00191308A1
IKDSIYCGIIDSFPLPQKYVNDLNIITADYLIKNIDASFSAWTESNWARHVNFDTFCEFILPYKVIEQQDLEDWRSYLLNFCDGDLRDHKYCELYKYSPYRACETVNEALRNFIHPRLINKYPLPVKKVSTLTKIPFGVCDDYNTLGIAIMRAKGIPCAMDFTPQWPFRSLGHTWCVLLENSGKTVIFEGADGAPARPHKQDHKMAKVFRKTYAINKDLVQMIKEERFVPSPFNEPFLKDVTTDYLKTVDIKVNDITKSKQNYAYLAVFDDQNWRPIHWARKSKKSFTFEKMGKDIVYLPVHFTKAGIEAFSDPILLTINGECVVLKADKTQKRDIFLYRKYPPMENMHHVSYRVINGKFQASNDSLFTDSSTVDIHIIKERAVVSKQIMLNNVDVKYRYWRYCSPNGGHCNMAELYFYEKKSGKEISGKVIGTEGSWRPLNEGYTRDAVFDRNALTFFDASQSDNCWVGMDFGTPVSIGHISFLPRNDGNCIEIGDEYELMYWDNNSWQSLGKQIANELQLQYKNCPSNALFLLHNHTKGKEERIFTYENNEQIWW